MSLIYTIKMYRRIPEVKLPQSPAIIILKKTDKENNDYKKWNLESSGAYFDPNSISNSPPNDFLNDLKKRMEIYR